MTDAQRAEELVDDADDRTGRPDRGAQFNGNSSLTPSRSAGQRHKTRRREVENGAYVEMMTRCIRALGKRVAAGDVEDLAKMLELRRLLDEEMGRAARALNEQGESWARIGRGARLTKQGAQQRWGKT